MKPLFHPAVDEITVEALLHALGDPIRVAILSDITHQENPQSCSTFCIVNNHPIPRSTLSQHFKILREAGLIRGERRGVEMHNTSRCAEVDQRFPGLIASIAKSYEVQAAREARAQRNATRRVTQSSTRTAKPRPRS